MLHFVNIFVIGKFVLQEFCYTELQFSSYFIATFDEQLCLLYCRRRVGWWELRKAQERKECSLLILPGRCEWFKMTNQKHELSENNHSDNKQLTDHLGRQQWSRAPGGRSDIACDHRKRRNTGNVSALKAQKMYHSYLENRTTFTEHLHTTKTGA